MIDSAFAQPMLNVLRIAVWSDDIADSSIDRIRALFRSHGSDITACDWDPDAAAMPPLLAELYRCWRDLAPPGGLPHLSQITPMAVRPALGYVSLLDPVDGGTEFRYRLYGSAMAAISGFDLTGKLQSEAPVSAHLREFVIAIDRAVYRTGRPFYSCHRPGNARRVAAWHRLSLPLVNDQGAVARLLAVNLPLSATGQLLRI